MTGEVLSRKVLNRSLLDRQRLLERATLPVSVAMERVGGLQTQYAPAGYIGLWSRLAGLTRDDLTKALVDRSVVQGTLMRSTIHMVSAADYWGFAGGVREGRRGWFLRTHAKAVGGIDEVGVPLGQRMEAVATVVRGLLADGPRPRSELVTALDEAGFPSVAWSGAGLWVDMVRVPPSGTWERRRAHLFGLAETWVGPDDATRESGLAYLVRRYLGGFGPATLNDIAGWAGLSTGELRPGVEALELRRYRDEEGRELLDLPDALLPDPATPAPVRFLPVWDATLLVHARRTQILPEEFRNLVFHTKNPQSVNTFLVDGSVAGSWRYEQGHIALQPFRKIPRTVQRELEAEAERLAAFHA